MMTDPAIDPATRKKMAAAPQLSAGSAAQLQRFLALEDILMGFSDGIDGDRLQAGLTWAKTGRADWQRQDLISLFAAPWVAAQEEAAWKGDPILQGEKDLDELTAVTAALTTRDKASSEPTGNPGELGALAEPGNGGLRPFGAKPTRCYCPPDRCDAPVIMGKQMPCLRAARDHG